MRAVLMFTVRYGIAAALILVGQIVLVASSGPNGAGWEGWALFTGAGVAVLLLNLLFRMGVQGDTERHREEAARRYFEEHGRWPNGD
jgi:Zn-dependent protease with chaperone function